MVGNGNICWREVKRKKNKSIEFFIRVVMARKKIRDVRAKEKKRI